MKHRRVYLGILDGSRDYIIPVMTVKQERELLLIEKYLGIEYEWTYENLTSKDRVAAFIEEHYQRALEIKAQNEPDMFGYRKEDYKNGMPHDIQEQALENY